MLSFPPALQHLPDGSSEPKPRCVPDGFLPGQVGTEPFGRVIQDPWHPRDENSPAAKDYKLSN